MYDILLKRMPAQTLGGTRTMVQYCVQSGKVCETNRPHGDQTLTQARCHSDSKLEMAKLIGSKPQLSCFLDGIQFEMLVDSAVIM